MFRKTILSVVLVLSILILSSCNLPNRQVVQSVTPTSQVSINIPASSPTPEPLCHNQYFPSSVGNRWEYSGSNTALSAYTRTDSIASSGSDSFTVDTALASVEYSADYSCTIAGLVAANPVQQYAGALLSSPNSTLAIRLNSNTGLTLPSAIAPGDTWQQTADFDATSPDFNLSGRFVFNYTAAGYETVTVPFGTLDALRVDATIRVELSGFHILAGTYTTTSWLVPGIGLVKSEGTSQIPGVGFTDSMQLTDFSQAP